MSKLALGFIEAIGLAAAIEAADVAAKSANIEIIGYELTKGDGMATVKIAGTVGAVKAAIDAAVASASIVNKVWGKSVIPRPGNGIEILIYNKETVGVETNQEQDAKENVHEELADGIVFDMENEDKDHEEAENVEDNKEVVQQQEQEIKIDAEDESEEFEGCNLCKDSKCSRRKGDLRVMCIHYEEFKKEGRFN